MFFGKFWNANNRKESSQKNISGRIQEAVRSRRKNHSSERILRLEVGQRIGLMNLRYVACAKSQLEESATSKEHEGLLHRGISVRGRQTCSESLFTSMSKAWLPGRRNPKLI